MFGETKKLNKKLVSAHAEIASLKNQVEELQEQLEDSEKMRRAESEKHDTRLQELTEGIKSRCERMTAKNRLVAMVLELEKGSNPQDLNDANQRLFGR